MGPPEDRTPRPRRWIALAAAAALAVAVGLLAWLVSTSGQSAAPDQASGPVAVGPPAEPSPRGLQFGASVNLLFNTHHFGPHELKAQLTALRGTGVTAARSDAFWEAAEPDPPVDGRHRYDWSFDDFVAGSLATNGLTWLPIIDYSAPWAESIRGNDHSPPISSIDYADYAGAFAARYGPGGTFWRGHPQLAPHPITTFEIWNEPDNPAFFTPTLDASRYVELYLRARDAIKAVDPGARVLVGGLTNIRAFVPAMLEARPDLRGHIDGVALHPYGRKPAGVLADVRIARLVLDSEGLPNVPVYVTEFGWTTRPAGALYWIPAAIRPGYIFQTIAALGRVDCGVAAVFLYTWASPQRDPTDPADWFGIHPPGGGSSADTAAFVHGLRVARAPGRRIGLCSSDRR